MQNQGSQMRFSFSKILKKRTAKLKMKKNNRKDEDDNFHFQRFLLLSQKILQPHAELFEMPGYLPLVVEEVKDGKKVQSTLVSESVVVDSFGKSHLSDLRACFPGQVLCLQPNPPTLGQSFLSQGSQTGSSSQQSKKIFNILPTSTMCHKNEEKRKK